MWRLVDRCIALSILPCTDINLAWLKGAQRSFTLHHGAQVLQIAGFKVGVCHGHQVVPWGDKEALAILQRQLGVDILVTGHTHEFKV